MQDIILSDLLRLLLPILSISLISLVVYAIWTLPPQGYDSYYFLVNKFGNNVTMFKTVHTLLVLLTFGMIYRFTRQLGGNPWVAIIIILGSMSAAWRLLVFELDDFMGAIFATMGLFQPTLAALVNLSLGSILIWKGLLVLLLPAILTIFIDERVAVTITMLALLIALPDGHGVSEQAFNPLLLGVSLVAWLFVSKMARVQKSAIKRAMLYAMWLSGFVRIKFAILTAIASAFAVSMYATDRQKVILSIVATLWAYATLVHILHNPLPSREFLDTASTICGEYNTLEVYNDWDVGYWLIASGCGNVSSYGSPSKQGTVPTRPYLFVTRNPQKVCEYPQLLSSVVLQTGNFHFGVCHAV